MKAPFLKPLLIANLIISVLMGAALYSENATVNQKRKAAESFQNIYLSSIRNSLDLGKSLNSYTDYMQKELRNPRGRDASIFVKRASSAAKLVLSSSGLDSGRAKELKSAFENLMKSGSSVMERVDRGDYEVAREVFEKDYRDKLKTFNLALDSHKKLIQNQANGFFTSRFLSGNEFKTGYSKMIGILIGLSLFLWFGVWLYLAKIKKAQKKLREEFGRERDQLTDRIFDLKEKIDGMRNFCERALEVSIPKFNQPSYKSAPIAPSAEKIRNALKNMKNDLEEEALKNDEVRSFYKELHEKNAHHAEKARTNVDNLRELKRLVLNSFLSNSSSRGAQDLIGTLEEAQASFEELSSTLRVEAPDNFKSKSLQSLRDIENSIKAYEMELKKFQALSVKQQEEAFEVLRCESEAFSKLLLERNENLAKALVLTDDDQVEPGDDKDLFEGLSQAA